ncbi:MAG TPA: hypothetical protein VF834_05875 [Streptosporangiaceae bacterium]
MDLRLHPGMHVEVDLAGMTVGGMPCGPGPWLPGVVVGTDGVGITLTVRLDAPVAGQDMVSVEQARARPRDPAAFGGDVIPAEVIALARAGKTAKAIKAYRQLNGASLAEAQAAIAGIS